VESKVSDLSPLTACVNLQTLECKGCEEVSDLSPLTACVNLQTLDCRWTKVSDLSPLSALTLLEKTVID
jgi:Leucine-rich repeat (LRR) protein